MAKAAAERQDVSGVHRLPVGVWGIAASLGGPVGVALFVQAAQRGHPWIASGWAAWTLGWLVYFVADRRSRTDVGLDGISVRRGWRWQHVAWDQVAAFSSATPRTAYPEVVTVRTVNGKKLNTQIPHRMQPALDRYMAKHVPRDS